MGVCMVSTKATVQRSVAWSCGGGMTSAPGGCSEPWSQVSGLREGCCTVTCREAVTPNGSERGLPVTQSPPDGCLLSTVPDKGAAGSPEARWLPSLTSRGTSLAFPLPVTSESLGPGGTKGPGFSVRGAVNG